MCVCFFFYCYAFGTCLERNVYWLHYYVVRENSETPVENLISALRRSNNNLCFGSIEMEKENVGYINEFFEFRVIENEILFEY